MPNLEQVNYIDNLQVFLIKNKLKNLYTIKL